ncbi:M23 family metallopeptidase [Brevundimonas sp. 2R-24]|uniref:M23 family metallopeptidase n=1 Tax=Peiella sedimenti TaxID=3061083 RepID=A0ABT8SHE7_9CAUL|nr:M23 family metallopeptidase [Caulobacteraceae bacterium XZ-24]
MNSPTKILAAFLAVTASVVAIGAASAQVREPGSPMQKAVAFLTKPAPKTELVAVTAYVGKDVDGDGAADFVNPTGKSVRRHDSFGQGHFHASRDGGSRRHAGVDYLADAGQAAQAPISGYVTKIGQTYGDTARYKYVEISNPALGYSARVFYVNPTVQVGQAVRVGQSVGRVQSLQGRYPGISDHVHLEVARAGRPLDAATLIAEQTRMVEVPA